jgi:tetratricopeptide (TPR) repeat protein
VRRTSPDFWTFSDELQKAYLESQPLEAGVLDYNRFENRYQWPLGLGILLFLIALAIPENKTVLNLPSLLKRGTRGVSQSELPGFWKTPPSPLFRKEGDSHLKFFLVLILYPVLLNASSLKDANRDFKRGRYEEAQKKYEAALVDRPHSPMLKYNLGNAAYQQGHFEEAGKKYADVIAMTSDPALKSLAHYNQGNAYYRQNQTTSAIEAYKEALRINPNDADAKYNLSLAMKAKQQGKGDPKQGNGNPEKVKDQNKQDSSQNAESKNKDPQSKDDQQKGTDQGQPKPKPGQMSKEDAERLLAAVQAGQPKTPTKKIKGNGKSQAEDW